MKSLKAFAKLLLKHDKKIKQLEEQTNELIDAVNMIIKILENKNKWQNK